LASQGARGFESHPLRHSFKDRNGPDERRSFGVVFRFLARFSDLLGLSMGLLGEIRREQQIERPSQLARDADKGFAAVFVFGCSDPQPLEECLVEGPANEGRGIGVDAVDVLD
jgi:hypothetical protein